MITIKQIAEEAGVSLTTVSNVIHGKRNKVSPQTVAKIQKLIEENNYVPRFGLSALKNTGSKMIGVLISTPVFVEHSPYERPFYGTVIGAIECELRKRGYYILLCASKDMQEVMRMTLGWNVDGVISISMPPKYYHEVQARTGKPVVSIDMDASEFDRVDECYNVTSEDCSGGEHMVNFLLEQGNQKVIYLCNTGSGADFRRYQGACKAYEKHFGKDAELERIFMGRTYAERQNDYDKLRKYIGRKVVLFFSTDLYAMEAIKFFHSKGIVIPEDISIVGFDDDIYARLSSPGLTTVRADVEEKAEEAINMLMRLLDGEKVERKNYFLDVEVIERESVWKKDW